jgi:hypothetical protein
MDTSTVTYSFSGVAARAYRARQEALKIAGEITERCGSRVFLSPHPDGSVLIVNTLEYDKIWAAAKPKRKARK